MSFLFKINNSEKFCHWLIMDKISTLLRKLMLIDMKEHNTKQTILVVLTSASQLQKSDRTIALFRAVSYRFINIYLFCHLIYVETIEIYQTVLLQK